MKIKRNSYLVQVVNTQKKVTFCFRNFNNFNFVLDKNLYGNKRTPANYVTKNNYGN